jgi:hypothetical protein
MQVGAHDMRLLGEVGRAYRQRRAGVLPVQDEVKHLLETSCTLPHGWNVWGNTGPKWEHK